MFDNKNAINLGRLKHTTNESCPDCGRKLQLRIRERLTDYVEFKRVDETEYLCCPNCGYERSVKSKKRKRDDSEW